MEKGQWDKLCSYLENWERAGKGRKVSKIKVGDFVRVINSGKTYSTWEEMAKEMGATKWEWKAVVKNGDCGFIRNISLHEREGEVALLDIGREKEVVIGISGLEKIEKGMVWKCFSEFYKKGENKMSRYEELLEKIRDLSLGWDKEADDILNEIYESNRHHYNIRIGIGRDSYIGIYEGEQQMERFHYEGQCNKIRAFKLACFWLLNHSNLKEDKRAEKIKEINKAIYELEEKIGEMKEEVRQLKGQEEG